MLTFTHTPTHTHTQTAKLVNIRVIKPIVLIG